MIFIFLVSTNLKTFIILVSNTTLTQNNYNENKKNSQSYVLLRMPFVFHKKGTIFRTSYSSKFEFCVLLLFRINKDKLITQPNKEAHRVHEA